MDSSDNVTSIWAQLPQDVCRYLLEKTARSNIRSALALVLVSKEVKQWIDPILYEELHPHVKRAYTALRRSIEARTPQFFRTTVKSLRVELVYGQNAYYILDTCTGVKTLEISAQATLGSVIETTPPLAAYTSLTHLILWNMVIPLENLELPHILTHLRIIGTKYRNITGLVAKLTADCPLITHIHLVHRVPSDNLETSIIPAIRNCRDLKVFVFGFEFINLSQLEEIGNVVRRIRESEPRFVGAAANRAWAPLNLEDSEAFVGLMYVPFRGQDPFDEAEKVIALNM